MIRKFLATAALTGVLAVAGTTVGAGAAGATTVSPATGSAPSGHHSCATAPAALARIATRQAKAQAWLPKAEQRLARAEHAGDAVRAGRIQHRISRVQTWESKARTRVEKIGQRCPGAAG